MNIIEMPVGDIRPYEKNAKMHDERQIKNVMESIKQFGYAQPLVVDKDNVLIIGHCRLIAAQRLGHDKVPVVRMDDLDAEQVEKLRLLDNKLNESDWDFGILADTIPELDFSGFDLDWGLPEIEEIPPVIENEDEIPEEVEPRCKEGDLWILGEHRLICGDSTRIDVVERLMGGEKADLLITDPPYNVDYTGKTKDALKIQNDKMENDTFRQFLRDAFSTANAVMREGAVFYIWHADSEGYNFRGACVDTDWKVRECLIWNKNTMVLGRQDYQWKHEPCQPAGTMVLTPDGERPIESLVDGDVVISWDSYSGQVKGYKNGGYAVKTASRPYKGTLYGISSCGRQTWATDNHQFSVRFNSSTRKNYCTYLMQRGDRWRVGIARAYDARQFGLKTRYHQEKAENMWLISLHEDKAEAQVMEQILSVKYGIPYTIWEIDRFDKTNRSMDQIESIYSALDSGKMKAGAIQLLRDFHRSEKYPLITPENKAEKFSTRVTAKINACNLVPELMQLPIPTKPSNPTNFKWAAIEKVEHKEHDGLVYSLSVEKYEHYISDGIITHNCLYGWKEGAGHTWNSDRCQTTVLDFDKPARSEMHPTMKPVALFSYQIENSSSKGERVLDLFGGSGTTLIACEELRRKAYLCELDPHYCDVIIERWERATGKTAVLEGDDEEGA